MDKVNRRRFFGLFGACAAGAAVPVATTARPCGAWGGEGSEAELWEATAERDEAERLLHSSREWLEMQAAERRRLGCWLRLRSSSASVSADTQVRACAALGIHPSNLARVRCTDTGMRGG